MRVTLLNDCKCQFITEIKGIQKKLNNYRMCEISAKRQLVESLQTIICKFSSLKWKLLSTLLDKTWALSHIINCKHQ